MSAGARPRLECRMPERVITLAISDADWKALRAVQPEPVDWLKRTIRDAIDQGAPLSRADAGRFFAAAVTAPGIDFAIVYAASRGGETLFDMAPAQKLLGYEPRERWPEGLPFPLPGD